MKRIFFKAVNCWAKDREETFAAVEVIVKTVKEFFHGIQATLGTIATAGTHLNYNSKIASFCNDKDDAE